MYELLKALMRMAQVAEEQAKYLAWHVDTTDPAQYPVLRVEVSITEADAEFVEQMRQLLAPRTTT